MAESDTLIDWEALSSLTYEEAYGVLREALESIDNIVNFAGMNNRLSEIEQVLMHLGDADHLTHAEQVAEREMIQAQQPVVNMEENKRRGCQTCTLEHRQCGQVNCLHTHDWLAAGRWTKADGQVAYHCYGRRAMVQRDGQTYPVKVSQDARVTMVVRGDTLYPNGILEDDVQPVVNEEGS